MSDFYPISQSVVTFEVKPWDDETDMKELEKCVRSVVWDGLLWGASKLVPVGYGVSKLQVSRFSLFHYMAFLVC